MRVVKMTRLCTYLSEYVTHRRDFKLRFDDHIEVLLRTVLSGDAGQALREFFRESLGGAYTGRGD